MRHTAKTVSKMLWQLDNKQPDIDEVRRICAAAHELGVRREDDPFLALVTFLECRRKPPESTLLARLKKVVATCIIAAVLVIAGTGTAALRMAWNDGYAAGLAAAGYKR